jgi:hypothetical protein
MQDTAITVTLPLHTMGFFNHGEHGENQGTVVTEYCLILHFSVSSAAIGF